MDFQPSCKSMDGRIMRILSQISQNQIKSSCKILYIYWQKPPNNSLWSEISFKWTSLNLISNDISDFEPLAPNHLLIGEASPNQSPGNFLKHAVSLRKWRSVQAATEMFWRRWVREYLPILTIRWKWNSKSHNFKVGDLVIAMMKDMPQSHWQMGRGLETYGGLNDVVHVVKLNTALGEMIRSASKIALLEANLNWLFVCIHLVGREDVTLSVTVTLWI